MRNNWNLLIVCFLCVLCFRPYQVNAQVQSQKKITIEISNERLPSVLKRLEKLSGYKILFTYDDVKKFTVSGSVKDKSIEQTLDIILANKPLEYHIEDQFITITTKGPSKQAKVFNVKGVVISGDDGQPLIGATVVIKGSKSGVLTDIDGKFSIENVSNKSLLQFSYIGMKPQDLTPAPNMNVTLMPDVQTLSEVVVTGMQKMDKRLFTGATKQLSADEVKLDGLPDISRGLEGRAAGVSVQNVSGTFGTAPKIRVRGATSIFGSSKPLWVVDGVIMEDAIDVGPDDLSSGDAETLISSAIAGLNSDDIESFQILKDGSATSIYGARAMAGVIVVTTKKGKAGVSKISYTGEFTTRMIPSYKEFNIMNSQEQMGIYKEMEQKGWLNNSDTYRAKDSGVYGRILVKSTPSSMHSFYELSHYLDGDKICLTTVDTIFKEEEFSGYIQQFIQEDKLDGLMAVTDFIDDEKPLYVETDNELYIRNFLDQADGDCRYISGGIYCLRRPALGVLNNAISQGMSRMRNYQRQLIAEGLRLKAYPFSKIIDVDHADDILKAESFLKS